ncbi:AAA family ATPase [Leifsonia aquatica]|uniref:AAA family ATPase n=1 Tax=Leifsonia aquatica TaxID=144185 RepID=UPI00384D3AFF
MSTDRLTVKPARPFIVLLSGMTGSGKSTLAERLSRFGVGRVSVDELVFEAHGAYGRDYPEYDYLPYEREAVTTAMEQVAVMVSSGRDVVLDHGLWTAWDRASMSAFALEHAAVPVHVGFPVQRSVIERRLIERNHRTDPHALFVSSDALNDFYARYEPIESAPGSVVDGTDGFGEVVRGIRAVAGRVPRTADPMTDLVLDGILAILSRMGVQVDDIEADVVTELDSLDVAELTVAIETTFDAALSPGEVLSAVAPEDMARLLRGLLHA